ncbi:MAG: prolipoprotein diacylglyceryl transferase [Bacteroidaceae bacterium]|nr:prolipoprotein diacylglyceryl transferase [Bacteroidaceae bacterium]
MFNLLSVVWNPELELFRLFGLPVRYYSLMWCIGLVAAYFLVRKFFKDRKISDDTFEPLFVYCFLGILIGARLGHCIFYQPDYYLTSFEHFIEMLLPIAFTPDGVKMVGYAGLASHGGTIGIFIAIYLYCRKYKVKLLEVVDMICVATPFTAGCIRIGNLMNSEIVGKATGTDWGFIFAALGEDFPRHPAQLYEAIAYFIIFVISLLIYRKHKDMVGSGFYFGFCLATIFTFRFFVEFCKEVQVDFEQGMALDMGQILSIPFMLIGAYFIYRGIKLKIKAKK